MPLAPQMVKPQELASWIKAKENIQVIDVRDDDYEGGAIVDHVHVPSAKFADQVANVIKENRDKDKIVFHCSLSQQRGPKAAKLYQESQRLQGESGKGPQVYVLEGGFVQWQREFGKDKEVTSKYDEEYWKGDHF